MTILVSFIEFSDSVIKLISHGIIGLSALSFCFIFYIFFKEQNKPEPRSNILNGLKFLSAYCIISVIVVGFFTLPVFDKNKQLQSSIDQVNSYQADVNRAIEDESRFVDSLLVINKKMQDSITSLYLKQGLQYNQGIFEKIISSMSNSSITVATFGKDSTFNIENKKKLDTLKSELVQANNLKNKLEAGTITKNEKTALIKLSGEVNNKIITLEKKQKENQVKVLRNKIQRITKPK